MARHFSDISTPSFNGKRERADINMNVWGRVALKFVYWKTTVLATPSYCPMLTTAQKVWTRRELEAMKWDDRKQVL